MHTDIEGCGFMKWIVSAQITGAQCISNQKSTNNSADLARYFLSRHVQINIENKYIKTK